jgi:hypothetical protein
MQVSGTVEITISLVIFPSNFAQSRRRWLAVPSSGSLADHFQVVPFQCTISALPWPFGVVWRLPRPAKLRRHSSAQPGVK